MKKFLLLFFFCSLAVFALAQNESVRPTGGVNLQRPISYAIIEGKKHYDVLMELKAAELDNIFSTGVKVVITHQLTGKKIYKKRFSNSFLYAFSDGSIQVGKGNAITQLLLVKIEDSDKWALEIREKGIY